MLRFDWLERRREKVLLQDIDALAERAMRYWEETTDPKWGKRFSEIWYEMDSLIERFSPEEIKTPMNVIPFRRREGK